MSQLLYNIKQITRMNTSNAFSDYMVTYSVNRSINLSPTSGRLHKQKERGSYGPTICLLNRSRDKNEESTAIESKEEPLLERILMLTMEIERLNVLLKETRGENEEKMARSKIRETSYLKQENEKLRTSLLRFESLQSDHEKKYQNEMFELKQKISMAEAENRTLTRKLKDYQKQIDELQIKGKINESIAERAKMEASRMEMSMHFNSTNIDLHKSVARERAMENQALRERVARCEDIINDQKFLINGQREENGKEKLKNLEVENKYQADLEYLRKQLEFTQREFLSKMQEEANRYQHQLKEWQSRAFSSEDELKDKLLIIANQVRTINEQEDNITELSGRLNDLEFNCHSKTIRAEESIKLVHKQKDRQVKKVNKEIQKYTEEIELLKVVIEQYKHALMEKEGEIEQSQAELQNKLKQKEREVKRISKRRREQEAQTKLNKSLSVDNSIVTNRLRASQVNLDLIVHSVMDLKTSNQRATKLIRTVSPVRDLYYAK